MKRTVLIFCVLSAALGLSACGSAVRFSSGGTTSSGPSRPSDSGELPPQSGATFRGLASYYAEQFHGRPTSSGEIYNMNDLTAAHRSLPFGTAVRVRNIRNNRTVTVRINDRGPQKQERIIDLSKAAAASLDMIRAGVVEVEITILH